VTGGAHHVGLSVSDLDAMIAWYVTALGFAEEVRFEVPAAGISGAMLRRPDGTGLELLHHPDATQRPPGDPGSAIRAGGYGHWALSVDDVAAAHAELLRAGAHEVWSPRSAPPPAHGSMSYVTDPEGNLLELVGPTH
jgi:catechol 2,3-dioxygenase-like lactoylglutathione lyase family enzyme